MLLRYHEEPLGDRGNRQDPLPENWRVLADQAGPMPHNFGVVKEGRLYRSAIVWPHQARYLNQHFGIRHVVSLIEGDWLQEFYDSPAINVHQFPVWERKALTSAHALSIADIIRHFEEPAIVHCLKGATRTGMIVGAYECLDSNGDATSVRKRLEVLANNVWHNCVNISAHKEVWRYPDSLAYKARN